MGTPAAAPRPAAHANAELIDRILASGLRGRGGGWFPAGRKWRAVAVEGGDPVVIANGAEGEPGSVKDRHVMTARTDAVLEGLEIAARAVGAREAIVFLKASMDGPARALAAALARRAGGGVPITVRHGDDSYITGEETALLEALEGRRPWPRPKPPLPAAVGLFGRPTLVQNVETLSYVPRAVADPAAFRAAETTLVSVWGDVARPGVHEVALGTPLRRVIEDRAGGATDGIGMIFPAGPSAAPLDEGGLDLPLDPDALREAGSGLGTASLLVVGRSACAIGIGVSLAAFFERESCGQCPPCVVGTGHLARTLRALEAGAARPRDLQYLDEAAGFMAAHGYCAHDRAAAAAVTGLLRRFRGDAEAHLAIGGCPRRGAARDPFAAGSPERRAIESAA